LSLAQPQTAEGSKYSLCPVICMLGLAQPQLQKWARCSYSCFSLMFMFREKMSQVPPVPEDYNVMPLTPRNASPPRVATVYNKLTGGGGYWCVSIQAPSLPCPGCMHVLSSVCCPFSASPVALRFLGQARVVHENCSLCLHTMCTAPCKCLLCLQSCHSDKGHRHGKMQEWPGLYIWDVARSGCEPSKCFGGLSPSVATSREWLLYPGGPQIDVSCWNWPEKV
jgi:hypothetical protein